MYEIKELLDLDKTIAAKLFEGKTYPWEALDGIKSFILELGETLSADEYDHPEEGVWIAKDAKIFPSAYIGCTLHHRPRRRGSSLRVYPRQRHSRQKRRRRQLHRAEKRRAV